MAIEIGWVGHYHVPTKNEKNKSCKVPSANLTYIIIAIEAMAIDIASCFPMKNDGSFQFVM